MWKASRCALFSPMPGSFASSFTRRAIGSATAIAPSYPRPGILIPPVASAMCASDAARAFSTPAFTAAETRSSSIERSAGSLPCCGSAFGSIWRRAISHLPFIRTLTSPPPDSASTEISESFSRASAMAFSSFFAWRMRYWMSIADLRPCLELVDVVDAAVEDLRGLADVRVVPRRLAHGGRARLALRRLRLRERGGRGRSAGVRRGGDRPALHDEPRRPAEQAREDRLDLGAAARQRSVGSAALRLRAEASASALRSG